MDPDQLHREIERARRTLHQLLGEATTDDLHRRSDGTKWTNEQLLFHMVFGYLLVRVLVVLARLLHRLPGTVGRGFARALNALSVPFHVINYWGSRSAAIVFNHCRMGFAMDRACRSLHRYLDTAPSGGLDEGMHVPVRWDPYFRDYMTIADIIHFATQHFDFHRRQLTLTSTGEQPR
ncbi:DinB family protein [Amycolatopsis lurida]